MKTSAKLFGVCCAMVGVLLLVGCNENAGKNAGKAVGDAVEKAGEKAKEAASAIGEEFSAATEKATEALKDVEGGSEILKNVTDFFKSAEESLSGIKDTETAKTAASKLGELEEKLGGWGASLEKLPEGAKEAIMGLVEKGKAKLAELVEKANSIDGVDSILKPAVDSVMEKISALTGKTE